MVILMRLFCLILTMSFSLHSQQIVINEVMASNIATIADEDGEYPDWIELYNAGNVPIDLENYALSDDPSNQLKWLLPQISIQPQQHLLIFASDKNRQHIINHWETVIDMGDPWKYHLGHANTPANWFTPEFDETTDAGWLDGISGFGYGDGDDSTIVTQTISVFIKKRFHVEDAAKIQRAILHVDWDDAFVAYLNGVEIARDNIGQPGIPPVFNQISSNQREAIMYQGEPPVAFEIEDIAALFVTGENVLSVQVHNRNINSSDLTIIPFLTFGSLSAPANSRGLSPWLDLKVANLHTNFKIQSEGEPILLSNAAGVILDLLEAVNIPTDISRGRVPDGGDTLAYFLEPTPGSSNSTEGVNGIASEPQFSQSSGFYPDAFNIELNTGNTAEMIHYTFNGATPTQDDSLYSGPITINQDVTVLRVRTFAPGKLPGKTITHTFFVNQDFQLPVISLSTDPEHFFDHESGIYVFGPNADTTSFPYWGSNFWEDWERPLHIEFFEENGDPGFRLDGGVKIFGSWGRLFPQKSLSIFARGVYGPDRIRYPIFPDKEISEFKSIVLRNSGQDWGRSLFRDALASSLIVDYPAADVQAYRPALVFLNGQNWGIHNIREKVSEHYFFYNHGVDPNNIDLIERGRDIIHGDKVHYDNLLGFVNSQDMSIPENYEYIKTQMDIENYNIFLISGLFYAKTDWPGNNRKAWRPRTPDGRWRWVTFDSDYGFSGGHLKEDADMFDFALGGNHQVARIFRSLRNNEEYQHTFINHYADLLNTAFKKERLVAKVAEFKARIEPEFPRHIEKWQNTFAGPWWLGNSTETMEEWYSKVDTVHNFVMERETFARANLMQQFNLVQVLPVNLDISSAGAGSIKLNTIFVADFPWQGNYFRDVPIELTAIPNNGFRFVRWSGSVDTTAATISVPMDGTINLQAHFESFNTNSSIVVINEINYNSDEVNFNPEDWVELYNNTGAPLDISGWRFQDEDDTHIYNFPPNTILNTDEYLVVCRDTLLFKVAFPNVSNYLGDLGFGFAGGGELLRLFNNAGIIVDSLTYDDVAPWPTGPDGNGPTLALKNPDLNNTLAENWAGSSGNGTPGEKNTDVFVVGLDDAGEVSGLPQKFSVAQNYPNPFNNQTTIEYSIPELARVSVILYNVLGEKIRNLPVAFRQPGNYSVTWDGKADHGKVAPSGMYFYKVTAKSVNQEFSETRKLLLIK